MDSLKELKLETFDVKHKLVCINDAELSDEQMAHISMTLKKSGALEVIYAYGGVDLKVLSDEDLENIGLCRMAEKKKPKDEPTH